MSSTKRFKLGIMLLALGQLPAAGFSQNYKVVDTDQTTYYNNLIVIPETLPGEDFYGQDANYQGNLPSYTDNGDGTVTDNVTGLMWQKSPDMNGDGDINVADKLSYDDALAGASSFNLSGYTDWRLPSIKEMYSLIVFSGIDPSGYEGTSTDDLVPFIDTDYFGFGYGDLAAGERIIDAQLASTTLYVGTTMVGAETMFGVNFADGRIKGYGTGPMPGQTVDKQFYVMYVRGGDDYGVNNFEDNGNGTVTDQATGLMWMQDDNGEGLNWQEALAYAESFVYGGYSDWRLPNVKELQSILDYGRSPSTTNSAAIDPIFNCTQMTDEGGSPDYPFYWSGTTHASWQADAPGGWGAYVCFGEGHGWMEEPPMSGNYIFMDVHGAGAQRSDSKMGNPDDYPYGNGPQGDVVRIYNYVRLVRDAGATGIGDLPSDTKDLQIFPNPAHEFLNFAIDETDADTQVLVSNLTGQVVIFTDASNHRIDISTLNTGIYTLSIITQNTRYHTKFIKN